MPWGLDDFLNENKDNRIERCANELASVQLVSAAEALKYFPGVELSASDNISYFPFVLCNSLPNINKRGRCFTPPVLERSFASIKDQLVNFEHQIAANFDGVADQICGHVKDARFIRQALHSSGSEAASTDLAYLPAQSMPVMGLGVLFRRAERGEQVIQSRFAQNHKWLVSMECAHDWQDAYLLYNQELLRIQDAPAEMVACIKADKCLPYQGQELAVALGGKTGQVDFWGVALTETPADAKADVLCFAAGRNRELASSRIFYMPMHALQLPSLEIASAAVDKEINELASVTVLGETEPCQPDGHTHKVLSDLSIFPTNGHSHSLRPFSIQRGTKPTLTGVTSEHYDRPVSSTSPSGYGPEQIHAHMVKIPLLGKYQDGKSQPDTVKSGATGSSSMASTTVTDGSIEAMAKSIVELTKRVGELASQMVSAKTEDERLSISKQMATVNQEIASHSQGEEIAAAVTKAIDDKLKSGELVSKEKADDATKAAVEAAEKKAADEAKERERVAGVKATRVKQVKDLGLDLEYELDAKDAAGKALTLAGIVDQLPADTAGDGLFATHMAAWKSMADAVCAAEAATPAAVAAAAADAKKVEETKAAEAASAANKGKKKSILLSVGGGPTGKEEVASVPEINAEPRTANIMKGRSIFSK